MSLRQFISARPFLTVIAAAVLLRLMAVVFSQGYMAHDDHFETIEIAASWQHEGIFLPDGTLRWEGKPDIGVMRSAVYNLFLLGLMKMTAAIGVTHLDIQMYFIRFVHALLSLLPVVFGYRYLKEETDDRTALVGGLMLAGHFLMPYLSVRNLVEMVSADFLFPCLYYATRSMKQQSDSDAILAGVLGGLALMIRLQVALALVFIPVAMVIRRRTWRQAIVISVTLLTMIAIQGALDIYTHDKFLGSVTNIVDNLGAPPTLPGPWYRYVLLLLAVMIPPFSLVFIGSFFQKRIIRNHLILWLASTAFVVGHSLIVNKQERFIIPIFPVLIVLGCVGMYYLAQAGGWYVRWRKLRIGLWSWFTAINIVLLIPFTFNYAHRGTVDSLVYLSREPDVGKVLFDCSERNLFVPYSYWQQNRSGVVILAQGEELRQAVASGRVSAQSPPDYIVIFSDEHLDEHLQILDKSLGTYWLVHHGKPSLIDVILNKLNPKYNHRNESWVVKRAS